MNRAPRIATAFLATVLPVLAACDQEEMRNQPKREAYEAAPELPGGVAALTPPEGTVSRDARIEARPSRPATTISLLERGQTVYDAICSPCHGRVGDGNGMIVQRGFPAPPSFHSRRLREVKDRHFYRVITEGYGLMYSYANRVEAEDRWAVSAYIWALQLSQHAEMSKLPQRLRREIVATAEGN